MKKSFLKKCAKWGVVCWIMLGMVGAVIPVATAEEPTLKKPQCPETGSILEELSQFGEESVIITELTEPVGGFDQIVINSDEKMVSAVYWKYNCYTAENEATSHYLYYTEGEYCPEGQTCTLVQIIVGTSGTGILKTYIAVVYRWASSIVGIIAVLVIVISGIQISMDQGSGEAVGAAKTRIFQSLAGLVVLFLSALILYTINPTFFTR